MYFDLVLIFIIVNKSWFRNTGPYSDKQIRILKSKLKQTNHPIGLSRHAFEGISPTAASRDWTIEVGAAPRPTSQSHHPVPLPRPTVLVPTPSPTTQSHHPVTPQYSGRNLWMVPLAHGASYSVNSLVTVINYLPSTEIAKNGLQWVIQESLLGNKFPV